MKFYALFISFSLVLVCSSTVMAQNSDPKVQADQISLLKKNYPFPISENELLPLFQDLYIHFYYDNPSARDSIWNLVENYSKPYSKLDSAVYITYTGFNDYFSHDYEKAIPHFNHAKYIFESEKHWSSYLELERYIANVHYFQKNVQRAFDIYEFINEHEEAQDYLKSRMEHNLGALLMELEVDAYSGPEGFKKDSITKIITDHFNTSLSLIDSTDLITKANTYSVLINVMFEQNRLDSANTLINEALDLATRANDPTRIAFTKIKKAVLLDSLKKYDESLVFIDSAIDYCNAVNDHSQLIHSQSVKAQILNKMGRSEEAYELTLENMRINQENLNEELNESLAKYETKYETASKELKIKDQEITIATRTRWTIILAAGLALFSLVFITLRQRQKRKAQAEKDAILIQSKQDTFTEVINAQENERKRIAKDLHDGIVQQLGGLKLGLQKIIGDQPNDQSKKLLNILDDSTEELRQLSHQMMPKALSELGLVPALEDMLENSLGHTAIEYKFEHFGIKQRIDEKKEIAIYRISQELINNVIKHSAATQVNIQLFKAAENLVLIVEDNGTGFNSTTKKSGIGLMNISSRLDTVKGHVNFEPSPESGTLATIKVPI